jgi:hypothetical protein
VITVYNGSKFIGKYLDAWAYRHGVELPIFPRRVTLLNGGMSVNDPASQFYCHKKCSKLLLSKNNCISDWSQYTLNHDSLLAFLDHTALPSVSVASLKSDLLFEMRHSAPCQHACNLVKQLLMLYQYVSDSAHHA